MKIILDFLLFMSLSLLAVALCINKLKLNRWWGVLFLFIFGLIQYLTNIFFIQYYIKKRAPAVIEADEIIGRPMKDREYLWEQTAGTGIVPKWVSGIGIWSMATFAGILVWALKLVFKF